MHRGYLDKKSEAKGAREVEEGCVQCASILSNVIERGRLPGENEWSAFELSGGQY